MGWGWVAVGLVFGFFYIMFDVFVKLVELIRKEEDFGNMCRM